MLLHKEENLMINYKGKFALVTGASSGIGKVYAERLAAEGCDIALVARSGQKLEELGKGLEKKYNISCYVIPCDLSEAESVQYIASRIEAIGRPVDILINSAGFGIYGRFEDISADREQQEIRLNIAALVELTHKFLPGMLKRREGIIVNISSLAAFNPTPYSAVYGATKAFVLSFTEALWAELQGSGVRVLTLVPGATKTKFFDGNEGMAAGASLSSPESVVEHAFRGLQKGKHYIVVGKVNYWLAQSVRFMTRKRTAMFMERLSRPKNTL
ncbi:MAG: SDR family NAD(P)-dependent oxidoreductase [Sphingobacterium hotanense]